MILTKSRDLLAETTEARFLLSTNDLSIGGSHDIRTYADLAARGGVLEPLALLEIKSTLIACRDLKKSLAHAAEKAPRLAQLAIGLPEPFGIIDAITRVLSERGEVLDSASDKLANVRREVRVARDRLMSRLQKYLTDSANKLQEPIITQRDGRYVIPLRAEFKGSIKAIVHDQSSSGATLFVEPLPVVELNNQVRELELAERDEERRILAELSSLVGEHAAELKYGIENLAVLDLAFAKAEYAEEIHASEPILHKMDHGSSRIEKTPTIVLLQTRHPLLDPNTVVSIDIDPKPGTRALVITGPNTGGKTVSLKTVRLAGAHGSKRIAYPGAERFGASVLPRYLRGYRRRAIHRAIAQHVFLAHHQHHPNLKESRCSRSLVILDELGAGTDPQEGARFGPRHPQLISSNAASRLLLQLIIPNSKRLLTAPMEWSMLRLNSMSRLCARPII